MANTQEFAKPNSLREREMEKNETKNSHSKAKEFIESHLVKIWL